tara:strand:- start:458 stop:655 length:198 start_codon:yes stop_codon:yes gene_type:complete
MAHTTWMGLCRRSTVSDPIREKQFQLAPESSEPQMDWSSLKTPANTLMIDLKKVIKGTRLAEKDT